MIDSIDHRLKKHDFPLIYFFASRSFDFLVTMDITNVFEVTDYLH
jgi:hypothetical protein